MENKLERNNHPNNSDESSSRDYKNSVFLPNTKFSMRANLAQTEPNILEFWQKIDIYKRLREKSKGLPKFILHFGPPYANGSIHIGHALSEVLKDITTKSYQIAGYDAPLVPGWDCHGLPVEWKIEEGYRAKGMKKEDVPTLEFMAECRAFAEKWVKLQGEEFERLGIIANWKKPYLTMAPKNESIIASKILELMMKGLLYKGLRPVMWSVVEKTALAETEVEYKDDYKSDAIYVKFDVKQTDIKELTNAALVIWTTTPWTIPGNRAIAYGEEFEYTVIEVKSPTDLIKEGQKLLVAKDLLPTFCKEVGITEYKTVKKINGTELKNTICWHPFRGKGYDFDVPALPGDHVTTEAGTGLVHTAPGHGVDDFMVGKKFGLEVPELVQGDGVYYHNVPIFAGMHVYKVGPSVIEELVKSGCLLQKQELIHKYPHSWRSKTPLIYRATSQWFLNIDQIREKGLAEIKNVKWTPAQGENRITSLVEGRPDWCLSRQRHWGTPIALFINKATKQPLKDENVNQRIVSAIAEQGIEAWHKFPDSHFLGEQYNPNDFEKVTDIVDVWFDSACTQEFVLKDQETWPELAWPANLYFEGSDQHRGWFQSSLMTSVALNGCAPYKEVVTHGFVLDKKGKKMSKSEGNVVAPQEIINKMGADIIRLWIVSSDYTEDLRIGDEILKRNEDIYRRFRNTLRYLLGALDGFTDEEKTDDLPELEQYILHGLSKLDQRYHECLKDYDFSGFYTDLHNFCTNDLSAFFFDIRKDSLYCDHINNPKRRATRTVMHQVFEYLVRWLSPVLSFTAEDAWQNFTGNNYSEAGESIHEKLIVPTPKEWRQDHLEAKWEEIRSIRSVITSALEKERAAKTIGSSLQAEVVIYASPERLSLLKSAGDLAELSITSAAKITVATPPSSAITLDEVPGIGVIVNMAVGGKCERCWRILPEVAPENSLSTSKGANQHNGREHPQICQRCEDVINA